MAKKVQQPPSHVAYFEEYDEHIGDVVSGTRQSANIALKRPQVKHSEFGSFDFASDSGYSSRTTTTGTSAQSHGSDLQALTLNTATSSRTPQHLPQPQPQPRVKEGRKEKGKQREDKRHPAEMMHMEHMRNGTGMAVPTRSSSKSHRRESMSMPRQPELCWEYGNGFHNVNPMHSAAPVDMNGYPPYYYSQAPPVQNTAPPPASPQSAHFQYQYPDVMIAHSSHRQRRPSRSSTYHPDGGGRPLSYHGGMQEAMFNPGALPMSRYEQGPPSTYSNAYYTQPPTPRQQYYAEPGSNYQAIYETSRSSMSRPREQGRRSSIIYGRPTMEHGAVKSSYEDGSFLERHASRESRPRRMSQSQRRPEPFDEDEAFYLMPPPPPPQPKKPKIIQKRPDLTHKAATTGSLPPPTNRRLSHSSRDSWDMSVLKQALPNQQVRPIQTPPERSRSMRTRKTSYHEPSASGREIAVENRRHRRTLYHEDEASARPVPASDLEQKHRNAEEYQAAKSGRSGVALTEDALLLKTKINQQRLASDSGSGSQKTRSNSSRGSDARTRDGSGVGSRIEDDSSFTMTMNGMTIGFTQESVNGKRIHLRADDNGSIGLNIEGRRPKRYIGAPGSDFTSVSSKKEIEDGRRAREDRRSDRASRRSSRSTYSGRFE